VEKFPAGKRFWIKNLCSCVFVASMNKEKAEKQNLGKAGWKQTSSPASADRREHYGYQFWRNGFGEKDIAKRWYIDLPADIYFADGYGGQDIYIIPSEKPIVVRLGLIVIEENTFLKKISDAVKHR